jgi:putative transposase
MNRVRLYPTPTQVERLRFMLDVTRQLYNALLEQRRYAWTSRRRSIRSREQYAELTALRHEDARLAAVYRECEDAVLHRLDLAMQAFLRRIRQGETPGYPRFKPRSRWKQLEFPHGDRALKLVGAVQRRVRIPGVGSVRLRKGRPVPEFGRAFLVEKNGGWYAVFECSREPQPLEPNGKLVGIDRGVHVLAAVSTGQLIRNPRHADRRRHIVERHARALDAVTCKDARGRVLNRRDPRRKAAVLRLARAKEREANARRNDLHQVARELVLANDVIALEELNLQGMTRSAKGSVQEPGRQVRAKAGLNRAMLDAGFGILRTLIVEKAEYAARRVIDVDARYSSQTCSRCGLAAAKSRRRRRFECVGCGFCVHADVNAALEIRRRAELRLTSELPPGEDPGRRAGRAA